MTSAPPSEPFAPRAAVPISADGAEAPVRVGIFLAPGFPLMPLASTLEPLRIANLLGRRQLFEWSMISEDGQPVESSAGLQFPVACGVQNAPRVDIAVVVAGWANAHYDNPAVLNWLRRLSHDGTRIGAVSHGAFVLARSGLLDGKRCSVHWESVEMLGELFHRVDVTNEIFSISEKVFTCAGGTSAIDVTLHLIGGYWGFNLARHVADQLIHPAIRDGQEASRVDLQARIGTTNSILLKAIGLIEENIAEPLKISELCRQSGTTMRHLERLFMRTFGVTPTRYAVDLRMSRARLMILQTDLPVLEVAIACGFYSNSHFTKRYREIFGHTPTAERRMVADRRNPARPASITLSNSDPARADR